MSNQQHDAFEWLRELSTAPNAPPLAGVALEAWHAAATGLFPAMTEVMLQIVAERERQDAKWGGPAHDDSHTTAEFVQIIQDYAGGARVMAGMNSADKAERRLIQVAALAVAAVESSRRRRPKCGNCDSRMPEGCGGLFDDEPQCMRNQGRIGA